MANLLELEVGDLKISSFFNWLEYVNEPITNYVDLSLNISWGFTWGCNSTTVPRRVVIFTL